MLKLLDQFGFPAQIRKAGRRRLGNLIRPKAPRMAERLVDDIFTAIDEQTVVVPGTDAAALIVPSLVGSLQAVLDQRKLLAARTEEPPGAPPSFQGPDVHARDRRQDRSQDPRRRRRRHQLPVHRLRRPRSTTRSSGSSIRGEQPSRRGNKQLKRALKRDTQALSSPDDADALFATLRDGTSYDPRPHGLKKPIGAPCQRGNIWA